jgi:hypothetical protein
MIFGLIAVSCSDDNDTRPYEDAKVVGVKVNSSLYLPSSYGTNEATIVIPAGTDLSKTKLQVLVVNGDLQNFTNDAYYDCKKPLDLSIKTYNGDNISYKLRVQSPPKLSNLIIDGLVVESEDIHTGDESIIVQVPESLDLTSQKVTMTFVNGTIQGFTNGAARDFTNPIAFSVLGVDEETVYPYELILTSDPVGPANIKHISINGIACDSVITSGTTVTPYIPSLTDFTNATITLECGYGNKIDANASLAGLNLLSGTNKVKVTGTDGVVIEFTIASPKLSVAPYLFKAYSDFGFGSDALSSFAFSGDYFVVANHNTSNAAAVPVGPNAYKLDGTYVGALSKTGTNIDGGAVTGIRKLCADESGNILGVQLGAGAAATKELVIWRWKDVNSDPEAYITFSQNSLGLGYAARSAGINVKGSLDKDALIIMPIAQKSDVFVWTVTGGVLNTTPQKYTFPYTPGYYYSVEALPLGQQGFVGAAVGNTFSGIVALTSTMTENHHMSGMITTDCSTIAYNGRTYLAYVVFQAGTGVFLRVCDITDGQSASYLNNLLNVKIPATASNGNGTVDAQFIVRNGKLHVGFSCTNYGVWLYQLDK